MAYSGVRHNAAAIRRARAAKSRRMGTNAPWIDRRLKVDIGVGRGVSAPFMAQACYAKKGVSAGEFTRDRSRRCGSGNGTSPSAAIRAALANLAKVKR